MSTSCVDPDGGTIVPGPGGADVDLDEGETVTCAFTLTSDGTPPTLTVPADLVVDATDAAGATVVYSASASDADPSPSLSCVPASGSVFPIGTTAVTCTATDAAGNSASAGFSVHVRGAAEQVTLLRETTLAYLDLPRLAPVFRLPLEAAGRALAASNIPATCVAINVYRVAVRVAPARAFTAAERAELIADAIRIRNVIGCR